MRVIQYEEEKAKTLLHGSLQIPVSSSSKHGNVRRSSTELHQGTFIEKKFLYIEGGLTLEQLSYRGF